MFDLSQSQLLVSISGVILIIFVYWFFLLKSFKEVKVIGSVEIEVNGGYKPEIITVPHGQTTSLTFYRTDPTSCLEEVVIPDFNIKKFLPLKNRVTIEIHPNTIGEVNFNCSMNMYHGKIRVT